MARMGLMGLQVRGTARMGRTVGGWPAWHAWRGRWWVGHRGRWAGGPYR